MLVKPPKRTFADGRDKVDKAIRKMHKAGPQRPDALEKVEQPSVANRKSVQTIKKLLRHRGSVAHLEVDLSDIPTALDYNYEIRDGRVIRKGLNPSFRKELSTAQWNRMTWQQRRDHFKKGSAAPRRLDPVNTQNPGNAPESSNSTWNNMHANTGATNDWHDQIVPTTKPVRVTFPQFGTPGRPDRDDAVEAIKEALTKPKRLGANPNRDDAFDRPGTIGD
jgi:hypothetical protein